jgi:threonine/homoserine/homoserine lactone efflux protein
MDLATFVKAAGVGLAVAAPVGPMALLCMRRTLTQGWRAGLAVGGGIALGDAVYGMIAALGLVSLSQFMLAHERPLHLAAGLFLVYLGWRTLAARRDSDAGAADVSRYAAHARGVSACTIAMLMTLTNPQTIVMFAALFAALTPRSGFALDVALTTVAGVFCGSMLWWCAWVAAVSLFRHAIGTRPRHVIDRVAGVALGIFGIVEVRRAL